MVISQKWLAEQLRAAAQAHHQYEATTLNGVRDEDWAEWYARWIYTNDSTSQEGQA